MRGAETVVENLSCKKGGGMRGAETTKALDLFALKLLQEGRRIERTETSRNLIALSLRTAACNRQRKKKD